MSTSISPTYDPASTAAALAQKYVSGIQDSLTTRTKDANAIDKGLNDLNSAIMAYQSRLEALTGLNKTVFAQSASFSDAAIGSATAGASAAPGSYSFFVKQLATASQVSFSGLVDDSGIGGNLVVKLGGGAGGSITVDLAKANTDGGALTPREIAAAINASSDNAQLVTASVVTTGSGSELVLTAKNTGASSAITLDTSGITSPASGGTGSGTSSLADANAATATRVHQLVLAQDAEIRVGSESGTPITQASNTFSSIDGVKMTFTKAQATGTPAVTLTVNADNSATTANVQAFLDAYNKLKSTLDAMVDPGDPAKGQAGGVFAHDGGIRALRDSMVSLMRPGGSASLASFGIVGTRDGTLTLDSNRLARQLALDPHGLDKLVGSTVSGAQGGIANAVDTFLKSWSDSGKGQIKKRQDANRTLQSDLSTRQDLLDKQYDTAYQRYLQQFTKLQQLQSQMANNTSMFDAMFGNDKSN